MSFKEGRSPLAVGIMIQGPYTGRGSWYYCTVSLLEECIMEAALNGPSGRTTLGPAVLTIGRVPSNSLVVNDAKASSRHAEISPTGTGYSITDVGSTNGTFVNEQKLDTN